VNSDRLARALATLRWGAEDLAAEAGVAERVARRWLSGRMDVPSAVLDWVEDLARYHRERPVPGKPS
jgi:hypothetical protein